MNDGNELDRARQVVDEHLEDAQAKTLPGNDLYNAERLRDHFGDDLKWAPEIGWMVWDGRRWACDYHKARTLAQESARRMFADLASMPASEQNDHLRWIRKSQNDYVIAGTLRQAQTMLRVDPHEIDTHKYRMNVGNGTLILSELENSLARPPVDGRPAELRKHSRKDGMTRITAVEYHRDVQCPIWESFLRRVLPDKSVRDFVQRAVGYSLTGDIGEHAFFFCYGKGANGKSTFTEVIQAMMGEYAATADPDLLMDKGKLAAGSNDVARLRGARFVSANETQEGRAWDERRVKEMTGGDTITARFLYGEYFSFVPEFKLWIRGNHKPIVRGTDDAVWRRFNLIPFTAQIPEGERDKHLKDKLMAELPGILRWAVEGCLQWQKQGLNPPEAVRAATQEYRTESDILGQFLDECVIAKLGATTPAGDLYEAYHGWAAACGHRRPLTKIMFCRRLEDRGYRYGEGRLRYTWMDVGLLAPRYKDAPATCPRCDGEGCEHCASVH